MKVNLLFASFLMLFSALGAEINYDIQDIGTTQTRASQAIALNNQGQILGSYNVDGSKEGKHFFVRSRDGSFYEVPSKENGVGCEINWRYLADDGKAYGSFDGNANYAVLYVWDQHNGVVRLGNLPGKEIAAINNAGQVLIKSVGENDNGKTVRRPVIWKDGQITRLKGLGGDIGIESEESYGLAMNNKGEVVGQSLVFLSYKNELYKQVHAVKWSNGQAIDLHTKVPKTAKTVGVGIKDNGEILIDIQEGATKFLVGKDGVVKKFNHVRDYINNAGYSYGSHFVFDINDNILCWIPGINEQLEKDYNSPWLKISKIISVNGNGEIIAQAQTIYGEEHAIFLAPIKK